MHIFFYQKNDVSGYEPNNQVNIYKPKTEVTGGKIIPKHLTMENLIYTYAGLFLNKFSERQK